MFPLFPSVVVLRVVLQEFDKVVVEGVPEGTLAPSTHSDPGVVTGTGESRPYRALWRAG